MSHTNLKRKLKGTKGEIVGNLLHIFREKKCSAMLKVKVRFFERTFKFSHVFGVTIHRSA